MSTQRKLFPHQVTASEFLAGRDGHLLAGEPGTGKSASAITAAARFGARRIVVTCPAVAVTNWIREFRLAGSDLEVVDVRRFPKKAAGADVMVMSVDWARSLAAQALLQSRRWDVHICDEGHMLMNPEALRTQALYGEHLKVEKTMILTGTPTPSHAGNLWPHINRTAPGRIGGMSYTDFTSTYCVTEMRKFAGMRFAQPVITKNNNVMIADLRRRLQGWWLRQRKEDVMSSLPPKIMNPVEIPAGRADIRAIEAEMDPEVFEALEWAVETGDTRVLDAMAAQLGTLRRLLAKTKVKPAVDYVRMLLEGGVDCLSVWGWHVEPLRDVGAALREAGYSIGLIDGSTPQAERDRIIDDFQAGRIQVFLGQIKAAGIAVTLTRASRAVFLEQSFTASDNEQAADRHHRLGQHSTVQVDTLVLTGTVDEAVAAIVERKRTEYETLSRSAVMQ
jgi:SWI/SNF-related matrix-associated actin-dependent regulator of chromatin subfamily A-like protein 1